MSRREGHWFGIVVGVAVLLTPLITSSKVLISKIQTAGVSTTDEFVELYNYSSTSVPLAGWSLKKQTSGGTQSNLVSSFGAASIGPFGYFLVAHHNFTPTNGIRADFFYTNNSTSLADHNSLLLFNDMGAVEDRVDWGAVDTAVGHTATNTKAGDSLVRLPNTDDGNGQDTDDSSVDFIVLPSTPYNSLSPARPTAPEQVPDQNQTTTPPAETIDWTVLKVNELMPNPENGPEWIELYNSGETTIDVSGTTVCDNRASSCTIASPTGTIPAAGWLVVYLEGSKLNNSGDAVILKDPHGITIDSVTYADNLQPESGQAVARTGNSWALTTNPTPGSANNITSPSPKIVSGGGGGSSVSPTTYSLPPTTSLIFATSTSPVTFNEIFPDPAGSDAENEFIELKNISAATVDLNGWKISNLKTSVTLTSTLGAAGIMAFSRSITKINLANSGEQKIYLLDTRGYVASVVSYTKAEPKASYARTDTGAWQWTTKVTRGLPNIFIKPDAVQIVWKIVAPWGTKPGATTTFDASLSADPRGGKLRYEWRFGDGVTIREPRAIRHFSTTGTVPILLVASSTQGTYSEKQLSIEVGESIGATMGEVVLNEVYANPSDDESAEYIELANHSDSAITLDGWKLKNNSGTEFTIPSSTTIDARGFIALFRTATHIAVNNTDDTIQLLSPYGTVVDKVRMSKSPEGQSYVRSGSSWRWSGSPTPNEANTEIAGIKIAATTPTTNVTGATRVVRTNVPLDEVRDLPKGTVVKISGIVSAAPGTFSTRYFYISDNEGGIEIYKTKGTAPSLALGDTVQIIGTVSALNGVPRINIRNPGDVVIQGRNNTLEAQSMQADENEDPPLGALVTLTGEVTEISGNTVYLDDGTNEYQIYIRQATKIPKTTFIKGENMRVTGIVEESKAGVQLLPRSVGDIVDLGPSADLQKQNNNAISTSSSTPYTAATLGGLGALVLAFAIQKRKFLLSLVKK